MIQINIKTLSNGLEAITPRVIDHSMYTMYMAGDSVRDAPDISVRRVYVRGLPVSR